MQPYQLVLFLHLCAVVAVFGFAAFIHLGVERLASAGTAEEALDALRLGHRGARAMPWLGLALLLTGAYLTQEAWSWSLPWVSASLAGLIVLEGVGGMSGKRRRRLRDRLQSRPGPLDAESLAAIHEPFLRASHTLLPLLTVGVMLVMVTKPGGLAAAGELLIAAAVGGYWGLSRRPAARAASSGGAR